MISLAALALVMAFVGSEDALSGDVKGAISDMAEAELLGHYDVEAVELLEVKGRDGEIGGAYPGYGLRTVRAVVHATRNKSWSKNLNPDIPTWPECESSTQLFLLCRPVGYRFLAEIEVDIALTTEGWKILSRNHRSMREYPLAKYLICPADKPGAKAKDIINGCFAPSPGPSLQWTPTRAT